MAARAYIGTSGWNYKHWRGCVYEDKLPVRRWLETLSANFDTVEINTSFYAIPKPASVAAWAANTRPEFRFAMKLWRGITHYRKLINAGDLTRRFLESAEVMPPERRAPLLIQLPPNLGPSVPRLLDYVAEFRSLASSTWRIAVEFRNGGWRDTNVLEELAAVDVAVCLHDMTGRADNFGANDASFFYVRRHGTNAGRYAGSYSPESLHADADNIRAWINRDKDVYVYFNNDIGGHAWHNATDLAANLRGR